MAAPTIPNGEEHFFNITYEGNGGGQRVGKFVPFTDNGTIAKSCIFNSADSPGLTHTLSGDGNKKKFTISFWVKPCKFTGGFQALVTGGGTGGGTAAAGVFFNANMQIYTYFFLAEAITTTRTFEDTSKFYHIVIRVDSTLSTADDRVRMYVDGDQITSFGTRNNPSQDAEETLFNVSGKNIDIGRHTTSANYLDAYMAEVNVADGQSYGPETFGLTDTTTGRWIPKSLSGITYGTNGFRMEFANSAGQTIGDDTSGQGNDKTVVNLATTDITTDSPTQNFAILSTNRIKSGFTLSEGNLKLVSNNTDGFCMSTMKIGGKFYIETEVDGFTGDAAQGIGFVEETVSLGTDPAGTSDIFGIYSNQTDFVIIRDGEYYQDSGGAISAGGIFQIAFDSSDLSNSKIYFGINNSKWYYEDMSENSSFNADRPTFTIDLRARTNLRFYVANRASTGNPGTSTFICNLGQKAYTYTAPTGFGSFIQDNLPETTKGIPDFVWVKNLDNSGRGLQMYDSSRGPLKTIYSNGTNTESTNDDSLQKFLKGGFEAEDFTGFNEANESHVAWNWVCNGGTTSANTDGSGAGACTFQVNDTAGFAITQYTGTGSDLVVQHGLTKKPEWTLIKSLDYASQSWTGTHVGLTNPDNYNIYLDLTSAEGNAGEEYVVQGVTTTVLHGSGNQHNRSGTKYIMYSWTGIPGYSKFGTFTGNGNTDGPFIFTGFKPAWVMIKERSGTADWFIFDTSRGKINGQVYRIKANTSETENTSNVMDILSNGFKLKVGDNDKNGSNETYIYMAFAEHPFVGDGTNPVTAR